MIYFFWKGDIPGQAREDSEIKASEVQAIFLPRTGIHALHHDTVSTSHSGLQTEPSISAMENKARLYVSYRALPSKVSQIHLCLFISGQA